MLPVTAIIQKPTQAAFMLGLCPSWHAGKSQMHFDIGSKDQPFFASHEISQVCRHFQEALADICCWTARVKHQIVLGSMLLREFQGNQECRA